MVLLADEILADGQHTTVLEALRRDSDGRLTFSAFEHDLPFALVEAFVANVRHAVAPVDPVPSDTT